MRVNTNKCVLKWAVRCGQEPAERGVASETIATTRIIIESPDVTVATEELSETCSSHLHPAALRCYGDTLLFR